MATDHSRPPIEPGSPFAFGVFEPTRPQNSMREKPSHLRQQSDTPAKLIRRGDGRQRRGMRLGGSNSSMSFSSHRPLLASSTITPMSSAKTRASVESSTTTIVGSPTSMDEGRGRLNWNEVAEMMEVPPLTAQEYEELPSAIQRKYFSARERNQILQNSSAVDGIYAHYSNISSRKWAPKSRRRGVRTQKQVLAEPVPLSPSTITPLSPAVQSPRDQLSREEQVRLVKRLRASVILEAANDAVSRLASPTSPRSIAASDTSFSTAVLTLGKLVGMDTRRAQTSDGRPMDDVAAREYLFDTLKWLDEDAKLDLRLQMEEQQAAEREAAERARQQSRPRTRQISISKLHLRRPSFSASRPDAREAVTSPVPQITSPALSQRSVTSQSHRNTRGLSIITPKHSRNTSITALDAGATHYQDAEARSKIRECLTSPNKFDEAIEYGFKSTEAVQTPKNPIYRMMSTKQSFKPVKELPKNGGTLQTFLDVDENEVGDDDDDKLSDHLTASDPDSPHTPRPEDDEPAIMGIPSIVSPHELPPKSPLNLTITPPSSSREMTLRMTLTRPDLRADDEQIYGWQLSQGRPVLTKKSQTAPVPPYRLDSPEPSSTPVTYVGGQRPKESIEQVLAGIDHWGPDPADNGVVRRIWNRVRRT